MPQIDTERAQKARDYLYSGEAFKETDEAVEDFEPVKGEEKAGTKKETEERDKRLEEARNALFSGKLFDTEEKDELL